MAGTVQIDIAEQRLADRVAKGHGTPFQPLADQSVAVVPTDYGVFTYANLPDPTKVPAGSRATAVNLGPVWNTGTAWVGAPAHTVDQLLVQVPANMPYILVQASAIEFTAAAGTFTALTATSSNGGATTRLTSSGNHGLSAASDGRLVYVSADAGIVAGAYAMTYVSAKAIDIAVPYVALTAPVVGMVASAHPFYSATIPAGAMGANGIVEAEIFLECSATASAKVLSMVWGGVDSGATVPVNGNTLYSMKLKTRICNQNNVAVQRISELDENAVTISQAAAGTRNTATTAQVFSLKGTLAAADEFFRLSSIQIVVYPRA